MLALQPVLGRVLQPVRSPRGAPWSPALLFASGAQGAWYDPSDFATLYQDSAGTTRVTATGQPVGKILDKSGRGNHATQATTTSRPTLQQDASGYYYLSCDGVDDYLASTCQTAASGIAFVAVSPSALAFQTPLASGAQTSAEAGVGVKLRSNGAVWAARCNGTTAASAQSPALLSANQGAVAGNQWDASHNVAHVNGDSTSTNFTAIDPTTSNAFHIGRANSASGNFEVFQGRIYAVLICNAAVDAANLARLKTYLGGRCGVSL